MTYQKQYRFNDYLQGAVVICFQNFIFDISETVGKKHILLICSCDLLSKFYL
ncbi:hypothetical protein BRDCF_p1867 [Bacteroidales bacterium CF]|nr:hypothetical protein BRDCF_p1867 [Bacteroidales bacterium CF]